TAPVWLCTEYADGLLSGAVKRPRGADQHVSGLVAARTARPGPLPAKTRRPYECVAHPHLPYTSRSLSAEQAAGAAFCLVAPRAGLEPATYCLGGSRSIH